MVRSLLAALIAFLALPALAGDLVQTATVDFAVGRPVKLDMMAGDLRISEFRILTDDRSLIESVLPPRGGQSRFSWLNYGVMVENATEKTWGVTIRIRLQDANGAVIDEFEFGGRVWRGRARTVDLRRLTLNYAVPMIKKVEITLTATP